jgi:hypothetical protein
MFVLHTQTSSSATLLRALAPPTRAVQGITATAVMQRPPVRVSVSQTPVCIRRTLYTQLHESHFGARRLGLERRLVSFIVVVRDVGV